MKRLFFIKGSRVNSINFLQKSFQKGPLRVKGRALIKILLILLILSLSSCGYSISGRKSLGIDSIKIGKIVNKTSEPYLQDELNTALVDEFQRRGVKITDLSENIIEGEITDYKLLLLSEQKGMGLEYQTQITGNFKVVCENKTFEYKGITSPSIDYFAAQNNLNSSISQKETSNQQAIKGVAFLIVTQISIRNPEY